MPTDNFRRVVCKSETRFKLSAFNSDSAPTMFRTTNLNQGCPKNKIVIMHLKVILIVIKYNIFLFQTITIDHRITSVYSYSNIQLK